MSTDERKFLMSSVFEQHSLFLNKQTCIQVDSAIAYIILLATIMSDTSHPNSCSTDQNRPVRVYICLFFKKWLQKKKGI